MRVLNWALDAQKTLGGKIISVILSVALIFSFSNFFYGDNAFAEEQEVESNTEVTTEPVQSEPVVTETEKKSEEPQSKTPEQESAETSQTEKATASEDQLSTQAEGDTDVNAGNKEESTENESSSTGTVEPSIVFDEETKTLTISGVESITKEMVKPYKTTAAKVVIKNSGSIAKESFAEFKFKELEISNVSHIEYAFRSCTNMETLSIDQVETIDTYAFYNPAKLKNAVIKNVETIGERAFAVFNNTIALTDLTLENIGTVSKYAFQNHSSLTNVSFNHVNKIGFQAFMNCSGLTELTLNGTVKELDVSAFLGCAGLTKLELDGVKVGSTAFQDCTGLETIKISNIESLGQQAFKGCTTLNEAILENVSNLGASVFDGCAGLMNVNISGSIKSVASPLFDNCDSVINLTGVDCDAIPRNIFSGANLKNVTMSGVSSIGNSAFYNANLSGSLAINAPEGTSLEQGCGYVGNISELPITMFTDCKGLKELTLNNVGTVCGKVSEDGKSCWGSILRCSDLEKLVIDGGESSTAIGPYAIAHCPKLKTVDLNNIDLIGAYAFYNCAELQTVTMNNIDSIANYAFWNCSKLQMIDSLSNVKTSIGGFAFYGCSSLTGLTVADLTKMGYIGSSEEIMARVQAILDGKFNLDDAENINELGLEEGWAAGEVGKSDNWNAYDNALRLWSKHAGQTRMLVLQK